MPAFSYKERFVPLVKGGTKCQTIRAFRRYPVKPGQMTMHFFGMRTKNCTRIIADRPCIDVQTIFILKNGDVFLADVMDKNEATAILYALDTNRTQLAKHLVAIIQLTEKEKNDLAWADGFRMDDYNEKNTAGCFELMFRWWNQTHALPFAGQLIKF